MAAPTPGGTGLKARDVLCPVCLVVTGRLGAMSGDLLYARTVTRNENASDDGARCLDHRRSIADRVAETARVMADVELGGLGRGE